MDDSSNLSMNQGPVSVRAKADADVRSAIISGRFAPGEHLSDRALCDLLGVSRNIVREVVRGLEAEGLVTVVPNRGPFVTVITSAEAVQIYELRGALEALAGEGFATRASDEERAELDRVFAAFCEAEDPATLPAIKQRFYDVLLKGCRNEYIGRTLHQYLNRISQLRATTMARPGRLEDTIAELRRVVEAIHARDGEAAALACRDHVRMAAAAAVVTLREREGRAATPPQKLVGAP